MLVTSAAGGVGLAAVDVAANLFGAKVIFVHIKDQYNSVY